MSRSPPWNYGERAMEGNKTSPRLHLSGWREKRDTWLDHYGSRSPFCPESVGYVELDHSLRSSSWRGDREFPRELVPLNLFRDRRIVDFCKRDGWPSDLTSMTRFWINSSRARRLRDLLSSSSPPVCAGYSGRLQLGLGIAGWVVLTSFSLGDVFGSEVICSHSQSDYPCCAFIYSLIHRAPEWVCLHVTLRAECWRSALVVMRNQYPQWHAISHQQSGYRTPAVLAALLLVVAVSVSYTHLTLPTIYSV